MSQREGQPRGGAQREREVGRDVGLALLALTVAIVAAFSPVFDAQFVNWDDNYNLEDLRARFADPLSFFHTTGRVDPYQPLAWCSLWLDAKLWGLDHGLDAPQAGHFHATSVALHVLAAWALFGLARELIRRARPDASTDASTAASPGALTLAALIAAGAFAVHPLRAESVAWVTERRDVLSGLFFAASALLWVRAAPREAPKIRSTKQALGALVLGALFVGLFFASVRVDGAAPLTWRGLGAAGLGAALCALAGCGWLAARATGRDTRGAAACLGALALAVLAYLSKGLSVLLPVALLIADIRPLRRASLSSAVALVVEKGALLSASLVGGVLASWAQVRAGQTLADWETHTLSERTLQAFYGVGFYLSRTLVPHSLSPIHLLPDELALDQARFAIPTFAVLAGAFALFAWRRRAAALIAALAAFVALLAPVLGFSQAGLQIVAERYTYLASMPLAIWIGGAWLRLRGHPARRAVDVLVGAWWLALLGATFAQARVWRDSQALWDRALAVDPANVAALEQLGAYRGLQAQAAEDPAERRRLLEEADALYLRALALDPTPRPSLPFSRAVNLLALNRPAEALEPLQRYCEQFPEKAPARAHLGAALAGCGRNEEAIAELERSVATDPSYAKGWQFLARAREQAGDRAGAIAAWERVLELLPGNRAALVRVSALRGQ